jgi:hypothetical protein
MRNTDQTNAGSLQGVGVFIFASVAAGAIIVVLFLSALEAPSGEGVPGPAEWARHGQSQTTGP